MSDTPPPVVDLHTLMLDWCMGVAKYLAWLVGDRVDECWIGEDLAIYLRYSQRSDRLGLRISDLTADVHAGGALDISRSTTSAEQAIDFFENYLVDGPGLASRWTDEIGTAWWADEAVPSWNGAVNGPRRTWIVPPGPQS